MERSPENCCGLDTSSWEPLSPYSWVTACDVVESEWARNQNAREQWVSGSSFENMVKISIIHAFNDK